MTPEKEIVFNFFNTYIPPIVLASSILLVLIFGHYIYKTKTKRKSPFLDFIASKALLFGFLSTLLATVVSLIYSDFLGQEPCGLCWFQRVFLYSQLVLFTIAYIKNDIKVFTYTIWLSIVGAIIAAYHEYVQLGYSELIPCPVSSVSADCAKPLFLSYGFVTFPFSSLVLFLFLIFLAIVLKNKKAN